MLSLLTDTFINFIGLPISPIINRQIFFKLNLKFCILKITVETMSFSFYWLVVACLFLCSHFSIFSPLVLSGLYNVGYAL